MRRLRYENRDLDEIDGRLLDALIENAKISTAELARRVGLSSPSVAERIRRLEDAGIIDGYAARINPKALGFGIAAWLRIRPLPGELGRVTQIIQDCDRVVECDRITGEDCFIAKVYVVSIDELEKIIDTVIPYAMTNTSVIQSSPVKSRTPRGVQSKVAQ